jgi:hypothetical protein
MVLVSGLRVSASYFFLLARCFGQDTLYDVGPFSELGTGFQHFSKRCSSNLCVFSWGWHGRSNLWEEADERNCSRGGVLSMVRLGAARAAHVTVQ